MLTKNPFWLSYPDTSFYKEWWISGDKGERKFDIVIFFQRKKTRSKKKIKWSSDRICPEEKEGNRESLVKFFLFPSRLIRATSISKLWRNLFSLSHSYQRKLFPSLVSLTALNSNSRNLERQRKNHLRTRILMGSSRSGLISRFCCIQMGCWFPEEVNSIARWGYILGIQAP